MALRGLARRRARQINGSTDENRKQQYYIGRGAQNPSHMFSEATMSRAILPQVLWQAQLRLQGGAGQGRSRSESISY